MKNETLKSLEEVLANSYALALKTQNYHWNITGENFKSLHELFGAQYEELFTAIDEIAERIRALGSKVEASFEYFAKKSQIESPKQNLSAKQMLKDLSESQSLLIKILESGIKVAQKEGDEASADLFIGRTQVHQKALWMIESSI